MIKSKIPTSMLFQRVFIIGLTFLMSSLLGRLYAQSYEEQSIRKGKEIIKINSFADSVNFHRTWNYGYPWGDDHNGTAKMKEKQVRLLNDELILTADLLGQKEGKSSKDPHLPITYHSGAVYSKELVCVDDQYTEWILQGDFKAPVDSGTWPAFWITGSETWPPESDILEFKGNNVNWQNTVDGADWQHTDWQTKKTTVNTAADEWHHYKLRMKKLENNLVGLEYYIDGKLIAAHQANFFTKPFRVVINLQMEQASGKTGVGPKQAIFRAKKVHVMGFEN